jgi:dihydroorotase
VKIETGEKANMTLFSDTETWEYEATAIVSKSKNSPFIGNTLTGKVKAVFNKGMFAQF